MTNGSMVEQASPNEKVHLVQANKYSKGYDTYQSTSQISASVGVVDAVTINELLPMRSASETIV